MSFRHLPISISDHASLVPCLGILADYTSTISSGLDRFLPLSDKFSTFSPPLLCCALPLATSVPFIGYMSMISSRLDQISTSWDNFSPSLLPSFLCWASLVSPIFASIHHVSIISPGLDQISGFSDKISSFLVPDSHHLPYLPVPWP